MNYIKTKNNVKISTVAFTPWWGWVLVAIRCLEDRGDYLPIYVELPENVVGIEKDKFGNKRLSQALLDEIMASLYALPQPIVRDCTLVGVTPSDTCVVVPDLECSVELNLQVYRAPSPRSPS